MNNHGGYRIGSGRTQLSEEEKKEGVNIYITSKEKELIERYGVGKSFSSKVVELFMSEIEKRKKRKIKFIDLFSGMGGIRIGFEQAFNEAGFETECILSSEIKESAIRALENNFDIHNLRGDITKISSDEIENFDFLLAGFPCQAFSSAGKGHGFADTRGTLFFEVERILKDKKPFGFILENVEGLITHDKEKDSNEYIGRTLKTILSSLENIGYKVTWKLLESQNFGVPQERKRVFITGTLTEKVDLDNFPVKKAVLNDILEKNLQTIDSKFTKCLLNHFKLEELHGKAIKDKRGGKNNIHSWTIGLKGEVTKEQKELLEKLLKERRKKIWSEKIGIKWMDGMPLTLEQISTFYNNEHLKELLDDLVEKGYLVFEHPKEEVTKLSENGKIIKEREYALTKPKGYNIVAGKLSFEFTKILDSHSTTPTLVAADVTHLGVIDNTGIRQLTLKEGLRLFGYPETYSLDYFKKEKNSLAKAFDLLGNTVVIPVVKAVANRLCEIYSK